MRRETRDIKPRQRARGERVIGNRSRQRAWGERAASNVSRLMSPRQAVRAFGAVLFSDTFLMVCND